MLGWGESAWFSLLMGVALKSTAVLGAAWLAAFALRGRSAAARHLVWTAAAAAVLALPLLSLALPSVRVPVGGAIPRLGVLFRTTATASVDAPAPRAAQTAAAPAAHSGPALPDWRLALMLLWAAGAGAGFAQMLAGFAAMRRMRRAACAFSDPDLPSLAGTLGIRGVDVLRAPAGCMPVSFGLLRPAIFMPADAAEWDRERRRVVLLHELAHVRRGDHATHLLARAALSLCWWNPLAWMAWREFLKERERAADDMVLDAGAAAPEYAGHLLEIARTMQSSQAVGWAAIAMARRSQLEGRLLAILDSKRKRRSPGRASAWVAMLAAVAVAGPLAVLQAQDSAPALPADVDATIRAATAQMNHELLDSAAKTAVALRQYDVAQKLLESSLNIRAQKSGEQSVEYGLGLLQLADVESKRGEAEAEASYQKAAAVLGNRPEAAPALLALGTFAAAIRKNFDSAFDYFQRAQLADPSKAAPALMWMAIVRERQGRAAEAEPLYQTAMAAADPNSADAPTAMEVYAQFLLRGDRGAEAKPIQERAAALRQAQGQHSEAVVSSRIAGAPDAIPSSAYRVGGPVTQPVLVQKVEPAYTEEARAAKYSGTVVLFVEIGPDGMARNMRVVRGLGLGLDEKAVEAVSHWQFQPGMRNGQPVTVQATVEVNFRLL